MKTKLIIAAALALPLLAGCIKEVETGPVGPKILRASIEQPSETRVSFNSSGKFSWNTGDKIAVHMGSSFVFDVAIESPETGAFSVAETAGNLRNFYAVYPSEAAVEDAALKVKLKTSYDIRSIVSGSGDPSDAYRPGEDYSPTPMVAENETDHDIIHFRHVGGLLRIRCDNAPAGVKRATVTFNKDVTGTYTVSTTDPFNPTITTTGTSSNNEVSFTISDAGVAAGSSFVLNVPVPCGTYETVDIKLFGSSATPLKAKTYAGAPLVFARRHGKLLLFGDGVYEFVLGELTEVTTEYTGGSKIMARDFVSYKTDGTFKEAARFELQYSTDGSDWTAPKPDWLTTGHSVDFNGSTEGETFVVEIAPQTNQARDLHAEELKSRTPMTTRQDLSLVNVATGVVADPANSTTGRKTANCYVVQRPGDYSFPMSYGNGIIGANNNYPAFRGHRGVYDTAHMIPDAGEGLTSGSPWQESTNEGNLHKQGFYGRFYTHENTYITSGWLWNVYPMNAHTYSVQLLWEDAPGLVTNVRSGDDRHFIFFTVPKENICQGNALIGVFIDGKLAWSWHIWVTDEDLTAVKAGSNGYKFMPVNIGWCDTKDLQRYDERQVYVRARQIESGQVSDAVLVTSRAGKRITLSGHGPRYQWGRKDPLTAAILRTEGRVTTEVSVTNKTYYPEGGAYLPGFSSGPWITIGTAIQHPNLSYSYYGPDPHGQNWYNTFAVNLWNSAMSLIGEPSLTARVQKTVYDPSPVGFKVPPQAAYGGFSNSNFVWYTDDVDAGRVYNGSLYFPLHSATENAGFWSASVEAIGGDVREAYRLYYTKDYVYHFSYTSNNIHQAVRPVVE